MLGFTFESLSSTHARSSSQFTFLVRYQFTDIRQPFSKSIDNDLYATTQLTSTVDSMPCILLDVIIEHLVLSVNSYGNISIGQFAMTDTNAAVWELTFPLRTLLSPILGRLSTRTPSFGSKQVSPLGPLAPNIPFRNCRIDCSSFTLFSTSPEAKWI
jgi:hypothetical protein